MMRLAARAHDLGIVDRHHRLPIADERAASFHLLRRREALRRRVVEAPQAIQGGPGRVERPGGQPRDLQRGLEHLIELARHADRLKYVDNKSDGDGDHEKLVLLGDDVKLQLLSAERDTVNELYRSGALHGEPRRRIERELDLRDAQLAGLADDE